MNTDLSEIRRKTVPVSQYIENLEQPSRNSFLNRKQAYRLNADAIHQLRKASGHMIVAFSAEWCKDCIAHIPALALLSEATGLEVRIFGGIEKNPVSLTEKWMTPPSLPEAAAFMVSKLPTIIVFNKEGREIGRIIENPEHASSLEQELCTIIKSSAASH